ncbi:MAG: site-2 protease family protein [Chloroflexi bacterium]|nr:site-2 protease family protein [Chloroflexota bacterium]
MGETYEPVKIIEPAWQTGDLSDRLTDMVRRVFRIEEMVRGDERQGYLMRYAGQLITEDSEAAYDQLYKQMEPYNVTPLFRWEDKRHAIILVEGRPKPKAGNPLVNLVLFILTLMSVALAGWLYQATELPTNFLQAIPQIFVQGLVFAGPLLLILGTHEFGHYLMGRYHGVHVSLPYFIPFPLSYFGTMGAFINMKEPPKNRRQLLDIGLAGPLAGLAVAIPVLIIGLLLSDISPLPNSIPRGQALQLEGNSVLYLFLKYLVFGELLPAPASYGDTPVWLYWLRFFFTGRPIPFGGSDVLLHPVAWAGWAGILVTALNLIPAGQLDGGHAMYVLVGRKNAQRLLPFILAGIAVLGLFWAGWWLWVALIFFLGRAYAEPLDQITPLDAPRRWLALLAIVIFFLVFTPVPLNVIGAF